ncbi:hypothetical protein BDZ45DRAFT_805059 [Acephala macrosclerotiorum]|nr:hypothetical protein BDZ45DRAFT_805059 [Acephala macrosclerotiorum]
MDLTMEDDDIRPSAQPDPSSDTVDLQESTGVHQLAIRPKADYKSAQLPTRKVFKKRSRRKRDTYPLGQEKIIVTGPFRVFTRSIFKEIKPEPGFEIEESAFDVLQEVSENFLIQIFQLASFSAIYAKRVTLHVKDMKEAVAQRAKGAVTGGPTLQEELMQKARHAEEDEHIIEGGKSDTIESEDSESGDVEM